MISVAELARLERDYYDSATPFGAKESIESLLSPIPPRENAARYEEIQTEGEELLVLAEQIDSRLLQNGQDLSSPYPLLHTSILSAGVASGKDATTHSQDQVVTLRRTPENQYIFEWVAFKYGTHWSADTLLNPTTYGRYSQINSGVCMSLVLDSAHQHAPVQRLFNPWIGDDGISQYFIWLHDLQTIQAFHKFLFQGDRKQYVREYAPVLDEINPGSRAHYGQSLWTVNSRDSSFISYEMLMVFATSAEDMLHQQGFEVDDFPEPLVHAVIAGTSEFFPSAEGTWIYDMTNQVDAGVFLVKQGGRYVFFLVEYPHNVRVQTKEERIKTRVIVYEYPTERESPLVVTSVVLDPSKGALTDYFTGREASPSSLARLSDILQGTKPQFRTYFLNEVS
ncbi:MAG: hypothetical protein Q7S76_01300 [bacterium]|nr:hypothetical protein [bacterium]